MQLDGNVKYSIIQQNKDNSMPVSVTWFSNVVLDVRDKSNFFNYTDRFSYFHQIIIARKISDKISIQIAPNLSHFNNIPGYKDGEGKIQPTLNNNHFAIAFSGRYKITNDLGLILNYDQPLTRHPTSNPRPNISFGLEVTTSAHSFQFFAGNYSGIIPQQNNVFNQNNYQKSQFLIGFNISRLWN
jgi:hypothetical protein